MGTPDSETVPCHYCGVDIEVPPERTRFEAFTAHFQSEHIRDRLTVPSERQGSDVPSDRGALADGSDGDD